jgi:hypothetical protein
MNEEFLFKGAQLIVPSFTKGKSQLSAKEVEESRFMSRARIPVERAMMPLFLLQLWLYNLWA